MTLVQHNLFHADPTDANATAHVWAAIARARQDVLALQGRPAVQRTTRATPNPDDTAAATPAFGVATDSDTATAASAAASAAVDAATGSGGGGSGRPGSTAAPLPFSTQVAVFTDSASALLWRLARRQGSTMQRGCGWVSRFRPLSHTNAPWVVHAGE